MKNNFSGKQFIQYLHKQALRVRKETLKIHKLACETRLASSLSCVEILTVLYYGNLLNFKIDNRGWKKRDRFIVSKGHGAISLYPILADLGFFDKKELKKVCKEGSILGGIPDIVVPGFETINGSLGHGLGVACGLALALKRRKQNENVFVLVGDGELYEGSVWEAIMFAGFHKLDNITLILDNNKICMLDLCKNILDMDPLEDKFNAFRWKVRRVNGHNIDELFKNLLYFKNDRSFQPKLLIADTVKGKGAPRLENDPLCHIKNLNAQEVDQLIKDMK